MRTMAALVGGWLLPLFALAQPAPSDFVTQVLEPTGGSILRPKDWYYSEAHRPAVYMWTLSREDARDNGRYTTGVRIQTFVGVQKATGRTARQFILDFVAGKRNAGVTILNACPETPQGLFIRVCLETEEGPYRLLYSLFWGSRGMDLAVISIAGTTRELWPVYASTFERMSAFELIDMSRFGK